MHHRRLYIVGRRLQDKLRQLRYDNARHRPPLRSLEHKHTYGQVVEASAPTLEGVLTEIVVERGIWRASCFTSPIKLEPTRWEIAQESDGSDLGMGLSLQTRTLRRLGTCQARRALKEGSPLR